MKLGRLEGNGELSAGQGNGDKGVYLNGGDQSVKLLTRVRNALRVSQYALETEKAYVDWMSELMYGSGSRRKEACRMRVKDVDLERRQLQIFDGKGDQGGVMVLPERLVEPLRRQVERVRRLHEQDLAAGHGRVWRPPALRRKYPNAEVELGWQYLALGVVLGKRGILEGGRARPLASSRTARPPRSPGRSWGGCGRP